MKVTVRYLGAGTLAAMVALLLAWPFLEPASRRGMAIAFGVALPAQALFFGLLVRAQARPAAFLRAWVAGMLGRLGLLGGFGVLVALRPELPPLATLVAFAGILFGLILLEPAFLDGPHGVHGRGR